MISAKILLDSVNHLGVRLTTYELTFPRWLLPELATHRVFSKNAASSRAIPTKKLIQKARWDPSMPYYWGKLQAGMTAVGEISPFKQLLGRFTWRLGAFVASWLSQVLLWLGVHKQLANRIIEPFLDITVILTGTEFDNFWLLRCEKNAQPEMQVLAYTMLNAYTHSVPKELKLHEWHIPFGDRMEGIPEANHIEVSVARAARISYMTHNNEIRLEDDLRLYSQLISSGHLSPTEHAAVVSDEAEKRACYKSNLGFGWLQYRKIIEVERGKPVVDTTKIMLTKPDWIKLP